MIPILLERFLRTGQCCEPRENKTFRTHPIEGAALPTAIAMFPGYVLPEQETHPPLELELELAREWALLLRPVLRQVLRQALRQVRLGCEAGLADERCCWVTPKLIDDVHAEVARQQGVAPCSADGGAEGGVNMQMHA